MNSNSDLFDRYERWIKKIAEFHKSQKSGHILTEDLGRHIKVLENMILYHKLRDEPFNSTELRPILSDIENLISILSEYLEFHPKLKEKFERLVLHSKSVRPTILESGEVLGE